MTVAKDALANQALTEIEALLTFRRRAFCAHPLPRDISLPQLYILMALHDGEGTTVSALSHSLGISAPSASSLVDRMEEHGYVVRVRDGSDRRLVHIQISPLGRQLVEEMAGMRREHVTQLLAVMTEGELLALLAGMAAVRAAVERRAGNETAAKAS